MYREAGSYWNALPREGDDQVEAAVTVPKEAPGFAAHVILKVTDTGKPPPMAYRRVILNVSGRPVEPPANFKPRSRRGIEVRRKAR